MKSRWYSLISRIVLLALLFSSSGVGIKAEAFSAPQSPSAGYSISGRVTDSGGNPVAGVTIEATGCDLSKQPVFLIHGWGGVLLLPR